MPRARANGIELEYDITGPADGEPLVLIMVAVNRAKVEAA